MRFEKMLSAEEKILTASQTVNIESSGSIGEMRCRCTQSRLITNRLARLERRNRNRIIRLQAYKRLRDSVPSIAQRPVSKLTIITEAARLIDELEAAVLNKFQSQGIPKCLQGIEVDSMVGENELRIEDVKQMMGQLLVKEQLLKPILCNKSLIINS